MSHVAVTRLFFRQERNKRKSPIQAKIANQCDLKPTTGLMHLTASTVHNGLPMTSKRREDTARTHGLRFRLTSICSG
jgi:hypothetical protein